MEHKCETCKFKQKRIFDALCNTCSVIWASDDGIDNWQPAKLKRKDLQAQLDVANAEIASMHNELQAKQDIIDEQESLLDEALATCTELADWASEWKRMYLESSNK